MDVDEVFDKVWMRLGEEKYLVWEVRIALLLATFISYFTMPFVVTFLLAIVWLTITATVRKSEQSESPDGKAAHNN